MIEFLTILVYSLIALAVAKISHLIDIYSTRKRGYASTPDPAPSIIFGLLWPIAIPMAICVAIFYFIVKRIKRLFFYE